MCAGDELRRSGGRLTLEEARHFSSCRHDTTLAYSGFDQPRSYSYFDISFRIRFMDRTLDRHGRIEQARQEELG